MTHEQGGYTYLHTIAEANHTPVKMIANKTRNLFHITILSQPDVAPFKLRLHNGHWRLEGHTPMQVQQLIPYLHEAAQQFYHKSAAN